jgi:hypothetical protein
MFFVCVAFAGTMTSAAPVAASSHHGPGARPPGSGACLSAPKLSATVGATWSGPSVTAGLSPGQKLCNYMSSTRATFLISHEVLDGSTMRALARDSFSGTRFVAVTVDGHKGLKGVRPGFDILLVQRGSEVYEFLDNSSMASAAQLEAVAKLVVP